MRYAIRAACLLLMTLFILCSTAPAPAVWPQDAPAPKVIFFVRHAEKATDDPDDPLLTEEGRQRAAVLTAMLRDARVTHLYASQYRRTRQTIAGLAEATELEVTVIEAENENEQVEALAALPGGSVAVVAGHSNTIPNLIRRLGALPVQMLSEDMYDRLFQVIIVPGAQPKLIVMHYGG